MRTLSSSYREEEVNERNLTYKLVRMESARQRTSIELLDTVVDYMIAGDASLFVARHLECRAKKLSASVFALTGLTLSLRKR